MRLAGEIGLLTCTFDLERNCWVIERTDTDKQYSLSPNAYFVCGIEYAKMIDRIVRALYAQEIANMSIINSFAATLAFNAATSATTAETIATTIIKKEKKQMKKDSSIAETVYQNTVEAIQDETKDKKKALDAEEQEKLAKAYADLERESMLEHVDKWAEELFARYEALHKKGFADELAIEILKIYISNH
jgi:hypothetical protein